MYNVCIKGGGANSHKNMQNGQPSKTDSAALSSAVHLIVILHLPSVLLVYLR